MERQMMKTASAEKEIRFMARGYYTSPAPPKSFLCENGIMLFDR
jgi:hypothetical protein